MLSVCSGIGGLDLGVGKYFNASVVGYVEREAFCLAHLVHKMEARELDPGPVFSDLADVPWGRLRGLVDIVAAGVPCQPFSEAGKRRGRDDERHLWPRFRDGLEELLPAVVVFENVDGIAHGPDPVLLDVLRDLERLDYRVEAASVSAEEVGAPHRRRRWFALAIHADSSERGPTIYADKKLADSDVGGLAEQRSTFDDNWGDAFWNHARGCCQDVADSEDDKRRCGIGEKKAGVRQEIQWGRGPSGSGSDGGAPDGPWSVEPKLGRVANGVSHRVDRLRALGNAVVPQQAYRALEILWRMHHG